jgi:hypothetical protein
MIPFLPSAENAKYALKEFITKALAKNILS